MIMARARAGTVAGVLCSLALAIVLVPVAMVDSLAKLPARPGLGDTAKITIRRSDGLVPRGAAPATPVVARGETVSGEAAAALAIHPAAEGQMAARALSLAFVFFVVGLLLTAMLRTTERGRLVRVQVALAALIVLFAAVVKAAL